MRVWVPSRPEESGRAYAEDRARFRRRRAWRPAAAVPAPLARLSKHRDPLPAPPVNGSRRWRERAHVRRDRATRATETRTNERMFQLSLTGWVQALHDREGD